LPVCPGPDGRSDVALDPGRAGAGEAVAGEVGSVSCVDGCSGARTTFVGGLCWTRREYVPVGSLMASMPSNGPAEPADKLRPRLRRPCKESRRRGSSPCVAERGQRFFLPPLGMSTQCWWAP